MLYKKKKEEEEKMITLISINYNKLIKFLFLIILINFQQ